MQAKNPRTDANVARRQAIARAAGYPTIVTCGGPDSEPLLAGGCYPDEVAVGFGAARNEPSVAPGSCADCEHGSASWIQDADA